MNEDNRRIELKELWTALEELVQLHAFYAHQLNWMDEGHRREFATGKEWILRLRETKRETKEQRDVTMPPV